MGEENDNGGNENNDSGKGFKAIDSQDALDRIVGERLARERAKFGDYDSLKDKAAKFDELDAKSKTELEKAQKAHADAVTWSSAVEGSLKSERIENAVLRAAGAKQIVDPDAAARLIDTSALEYDEVGKPKNVDALLDALVKDKPYLKSGTTPRTRPQAKASTKEGDGDGKDDKESGKRSANEALQEFFNGK